MDGMSTKELLDELNLHRITQGLSPLKSWKASRTKLIEMVDKTRSAVQGVNDVATLKADLADLPSELTEERAETETALRDAELKQAQRTTRKLEKVARTSKAPTRKSKAATTREPSEFVAWCVKHKIDPKVARAKLRRNGMEGPYSVTKAVTKILKPE